MKHSSKRRRTDDGGQKAQKTECAVEPRAAAVAAGPGAAADTVGPAINPAKAAKAAARAAKAIEAAARAARKADKAAAKAAAEQLAKRRAKALKLEAKLAAAGDPSKRAALQAKLSAVLSKVGAAAAAATAAAAALAAAAPAQALKRQRQAPGDPTPALAQERRSQPQAQPRPLVFARPSAPSGAIGGVKLTAEERARRAQRSQRFAPEIAQQRRALLQGAGGGAGGAADDGEGAGQLRLGGEGTCLSLEKEYLRLTRLPLASEVRPPAVLRRALELVKRRWRDGGCGYHYVWQQLKSIRQDLTVQGVADGLAVDVYETHGRVALETGDTAEFRQCLAVLRRLYAKGLPGNAAEFAAYGVLFAAGHGHRMLAHELAQLDGSLLADPAVQHALQAARAARSGAYLRFVQLYADAPRMSPYLMDALLDRVRARALRTLAFAYSPLPLPLDWAAAQLGFDGAAEAAAWLRSRGAAVDEGRGQLLTRESRLVG